MELDYDEGQIGSFSSDHRAKLIKEDGSTVEGTEMGNVYLDHGPNGA